MKTVLILGGALLALTVLAVATGPPPSNTIPTDSPYQVLTDLDQAQMLETHQPMMGQMQASSTPQMTGRMPQDPMWQMLDSPMVDLMEQNQAQIDRMLAR